MLRTAAALSAWVLLCLVAFWTLGPLADRPTLAPPQIERFGAYFVLAVLFATAYSRPRLITLCIGVAAIALELGQLFVPGRDAGFPDVIAKVSGAIVGVIVVTAARSYLNNKKAGESGHVQR